MTQLNTADDYAEGGDATNGMGTPAGMEGIGGKPPTLGTTAEIGGSVTFGMAGIAGIGGSAAAFGTVGTVTAGIGGTAPTAGILGNAGIGGTAPAVGTVGIGGRVAAGTVTVGTMTGGFGTAGMPGTAAGAAVVVSARCRAAWHVLLPSSTMSAIITSAVAKKRDDPAEEAMATTS